jgi:hypothetical protein
MPANHRGSGVRREREGNFLHSKTLDPNQIHADASCRRTLPGQMGDIHMAHDHPGFLRRQAERCRRVAERIANPEIARELREIAQAFLDEADAFDDHERKPS